jgi:hypothetical protein
MLGHNEDMLCHHTVPSVGVIRNEYVNVPVRTFPSLPGNPGFIYQLFRVSVTHEAAVVHVAHLANGSLLIAAFDIAALHRSLGSKRLQLPLTQFASVVPLAEIPGVHLGRAVLYGAATEGK